MDYDFEWNGCVTNDMKKSFEENGFFVARNFMDSEEVEQIAKVLQGENSILQHSYMTYEENGRRICRTLCAYPGNDVTGIVARSEKMAGSAEKAHEHLLGSEVYHWCSMFIIKDARVGGEHVWHQDYGYWYNDGCLYPDMLTMWIALDKCDKDNSCKQLMTMDSHVFSPSLKVFRGSHKMGRINHAKVTSGQTGADENRVNLISRQCEHLYLEMEPGDVFIHHGNLLHRSEANRSPRDRRGFMCCYNAAHNSPVQETHYPTYNKLVKLPDYIIKTCRNYSDFSGKEFIKRAVNNMKRKAEGKRQTIDETAST